MSDTEGATSSENNTTMFNTSQRTGNAGKDFEVLKLKIHTCEDYIRWKWELEWWEEVRKIEKRCRGAHVVLNDWRMPKLKTLPPAFQRAEFPQTMA